MITDGSVDRTQAYGCVVRPHQTDRFVRAIRAGRVLVWKGILTDIHGQTYWNVESLVLNRILDQELDRLGY